MFLVARVGRALIGQLAMKTMMDVLASAGYKQPQDTTIHELSYSCALRLLQSQPQTTEMIGL
jgi:hypothetical protein